MYNIIMKKIEPIMLLSTVNCSIGNIKNHFDSSALAKLFYKEQSMYSAKDKYAVGIIQNEALKVEIDDFKHFFHVPQKNIDSILSYEYT